ncbi:Hypp265 [Branchiostoma lanceolatum]|uniref:Hypp265 protein n=1 Tax=Branchiostoma lanceolatum TaxID=7740 RepID=A0A8J9YQ80_BRALA|nr:Hypp265 [Branchiostoma lanceolatum]
MAPNVSVFHVDVAVKTTLVVINQEGGPFAMSDEMLKANKILLDSIENITSGGLQGELPRDFKWMLGDLEIGILKSSIEIQAKVRKLLNLCSLVREAVDDNTQPLDKFLENINLSKYVEAVTSAFEGLTIEDFTDDLTDEDLATELEPHITSKIHRKKVVREIKKCGAKKDDLPEVTKEMRETLVEILKLSEKMANDIPLIKQKMRDAIKSKQRVQENCQNDKKYSSWAKFAFGSLCVVGAVATLGVGIAVAGGALAVGTGAAAAGVLVTGAAASGCYAYYSHKKTLELSDYMAQLEGTLDAMDVAQRHVEKRETDWMNFVHDPASQAQTDQSQVGKRVSKLPSSTTHKKKFQKDMEKSEKTLQKFDEGMTCLKDTANAVLKVLHG